jgi:hypothetical protein
MTKQQFDIYRFSVNTEVNCFEDIWDKVTEVDFEEGWVGIERGQIIRYYDIKDIRERS